MLTKVELHSDAKLIERTQALDVLLKCEAKSNVGLFNFENNLEMVKVLFLLIRVIIKQSCSFCR